MSSREQRKQAVREERLAAERRAARAATQRRRVRLAGGVSALLAVILVPALVFSPSAPDPGSSEIGSRPIPERVVTDLGEAVRRADAQRISHPYAFGINDHTDEPVAYPTNPPTNGPHAFTWTQDGNYAGQAPPPTGQVVHAQEHGRVVIQYRPGIAREKLEQLVALYEEDPQHVLLVENATGMRCEVAATAWGQGVLCETLTDRSFDALRAFRDRYRDRGPESVA